jgi:ATP-dependent DNA ligase
MLARIATCAYPFPMLITPARHYRVDLGYALDCCGVGWTVEPWVGGIRCIISIDTGGAAQAMSTNGLPITRTAAHQPWHQHLAGCIFDGQLVGHTYHIADLASYLGQDITSLPLHERRRLLATLADWTPAHTVITKATPCPADDIKAGTRYCFRNQWGNWRHEVFITKPCSS